MPAYECISVHQDQHARYGHNWLRLFRRGDQVTAIAAEVAGNLGPRLVDAMPDFIHYLARRYRLDSGALTMVEHHTPDFLGVEAGTYDLVRLQWRGRGMDVERRHLSVEDAEWLAGEPLPTRRPFWNRQNDVLTCWVGERIASVEPRGGRWQANIVHEEMRPSRGQPGMLVADFRTREDAQFWVLSELAMLAMQYDEPRV